eukprot:TRINITY_DN13995_c0_g1_i1.p1 TRINITY_DN13995_c0_g1~~TRINITY_DN13995_c0_g1_i1.p1  ORF type:complete len:257 (+),score=65.77 TRINITY_DN13995_c0_g1_i1:81-773(+)
MAAGADTAVAEEAAVAQCARLLRTPVRPAAADAYGVGLAFDVQARRLPVHISAVHLGGLHEETAPNCALYACCGSYTDHLDTPAAWRQVGGPVRLRPYQETRVPLWDPLLLEPHARQGLMAFSATPLLGRVVFAAMATAPGSEVARDGAVIICTGDQVSREMVVCDDDDRSLAGAVEYEVGWLRCRKGTALRMAMLCAAGRASPLCAAAADLGVLRRVEPGLLRCCLSFL